MSGFGSNGHRALIGEVVDFYELDERVRSVAVFGSVASGTWHELSDVDLDVVIEDGAVIVPADEVEALFGRRAVIVLTTGDAADVVLDSLEELSITWHPLAETSPNISASVRVVGGRLSDSDVKGAGESNRAVPDHDRLLDALVREAIGAWKALARGEGWSAVAAVERMRGSLLALRGRRDTLRLDPADPADALAKVLAETRAACDLGPARDRSSRSSPSLKPELLDDLVDVDDEVDAAAVFTRSNLAFDRAEDVVQPAVALIVGQVNCARDDLAAPLRIAAPVALPVEEDRRAVVGLDHALEVRAERAVGPPPRMVRAAHASRDPAFAAAFGDEEVVLEPALELRDGLLLIVREPDPVQRLEPHSAIGSHMSS